MQDLPAHGVGQQYAATLTSTAVILRAVQQAHQCRQGVLTSQNPTRQAADPLPAFQSAAGDLALTLYPSPHSKYCAVRYSRPGSHNELQQPYVSQRSGLALYDSHTGRLLHSLRNNDEYGCRVCWSACSTRLHVEVTVTGNDELVVIYEVPSGRIVTPQWTPEAAAVLSDRSRIGANLWAPDGKHILVSTQAPGPEKMLHVLHAVTGALVASATITDVRCSRPCEVCLYSHPPVVWHPSSIGVVVPTCTWALKGPTPLRAAELKFGHCDATAHLIPQATHLSPDGKHLVAPAFVQAYGRPGGAVAIMQCVEEAECLIFPLLRVLGDYDSPISEARWCPRPGADADLLVRIGSCLTSRGALRLVTSTGRWLSQPAPTEFCLRQVSTFSPWTTSPCGRFCQVERREGRWLVPYILHIATGAVYAIPGSSSEVSVELRWSSCGARIPQQTTQVCSAFVEEIRVQSFAVLHYAAS